MKLALRRSSPNKILLSGGSAVALMAAFAAPAWAQVAPGSASGATEQELVSTAPDQGRVEGRVTSDSNERVAGASIRLEGAGVSTQTDNAGRFVFNGVPAGDYALIATAGGNEVRRTVTLAGGQVLVADMVLDMLSGAEVDAVTVTGTRPGAVRRASSPISVVTATEIERKQVTNMTDLLRGEIPGIFVVNSGSNDWTTQVYTRGSTSWNYALSDLHNDYAKVFIDGAELSRPTLLSMIDPRTIERIETVRGPQAGIIYGTDGANGLMKIVTKKGGTGQMRPQLMVQLSGGVMESEYAPDARCIHVLRRE